MNIKYVSLLSLLCVANINAITVVERIDKANKELLACEKQKREQSTLSKLTGCISCKQQEMEFEAAVTEIRDLLSNKKNTSRKAHQSIFSDLPWNRKKTKQAAEIFFVCDEILEHEAYHPSKFSYGEDHYKSFEQKFDRWMASYNTSEETKKALKEEILYTQSKQK